MSNHKNIANGLIDGDISDSITTITLQSGYGSSMPAAPFYATLSPFGQLPTLGNSEIVQVTTVAGDTLDITRAQRGTTAKPFEDGDIIVNGVYVEDIDEKADTTYVDTNDSNTLNAAKAYADSEIGTVNASLDTKVDKVAGKGLSTNDYTLTEKNKLANIESGAEVNTVNTVNSRTGNVTGLAEQSDLTAHTTNTSNPHSVTKAQVGLGNADNTSDLSKPVSTATQTALNAKANATDTVNLTGNQTIAGVKTFSSSPAVPTATTGTQAVNKEQMDTALSGKVNITPLARRIYSTDDSGAQVTREYSDVAAIGGSVAGRNANGQIIAAGATTAGQLATKGQMDAADDLKVNKSGDTMTGPLAIDSNTMTPINISGTGGSNFLNITMTNNNANTGSQNINERRLIKNSAGTLRPALEQFSYLTTPTAGAERSTVRYFTFSDGVQIKVMEFNGPDVLVENQLSVGGARYMSGTGFPNGVVSAPVGSTYIDRNATNGAIEWKKATGTGNTGWVVSVGNTGWRDITSLFGTQLSTNNPNDYGIYIRRKGELVTLNFKCAIGTGYSGSSVAIPTGFRAGGASINATLPFSILNLWQTAGSNSGQVQISTDFGFVAFTNSTAGTRYYGSLTYLANDGYPSTLPGTPV